MGFVRYVSFTGSKQGKITGVPIKNKGHNWSEIVAVMYSSKQTGNATDKRQQNPLSIIKSGHTPPQLALAMHSNEILTEVVIEVWSAPPTGVETLAKRITLTDATVSGIKPHIGGSKRAGGLNKQVSFTDISFTFNKITIDLFGQGVTAPDDWINGA